MSESSYKKLTVWFLATSSLLLLLIALLNYLMDPAHLFQEGKYEQGVAELMVAGKNVGNVTNFDERLLQKLYIEQSKQRKDVVVLGSSRSMQLRGDSFPGQAFFNSAVSGANLEDVLAIYQMYRQQGREPETVVFGIDPWIFNQNNGQTRWKSVASEYYEFLNVLQVGGLETTAEQNNLTEKVQQLVSYDYTKSSVQKFLNGDSPYYATDKTESKDLIKLADGSLVYDEATRGKSVEQINQAAQEYASSNPIYSLGHFSEIDGVEQAKFEAFVSYLKTQNKNVVFFLSPYHPAVYQTIATTKDYQMVGEVEQYLRTFAEANGIKVIGSYDPAVIGAKDQDFYDGMHPKAEYLKTLF